VIDCVALNCSLNEVTPAPTISVPEETAELVAVPEVALNCKLPTKVSPAAVVIPTKALCIKNFVGVTILAGAVVSNVPSSTRTSPSA